MLDLIRLFVQHILSHIIGCKKFPIWDGSKAFPAKGKHFPLAVKSLFTGHEAGTVLEPQQLHKYYKMESGRLKSCDRSKVIHLIEHEADFGKSNDGIAARGCGGCGGCVTTLLGVLIPNYSNFKCS